MAATRIVDKIGEGGMGTVYRGKQHSVGRECAIKVVNPNLVREPVAIKRFLREAKLASRLAHPNAVAVLDFGQTDDGLFFLVMELVSGRTLDRVLEEDRELAPSRVARIGTQICDALEGAHAIDIMHRDLKPANVMIISTGRDLVKVLDFGLAKSLSPDATSNKTTNAGALLGTPAYMPPELVSGGAVDGRADLYSLGCVLYQAASGRLPFWSENVHDLVAMHVSARPPKLAGVPRRLAQVIEKMLAKAPGDCFASAAHAREALEAAVNMIPDTLDETPGFGSTMLGWAGRARSDTLKSIEPPSHVSFGTPEPTSNPDPRADRSEPVGAASHAGQREHRVGGPGDATSVGSRRRPRAGHGARPPGPMGRWRDHADPVAGQPRAAGARQCARRRATGGRRRQGVADRAGPQGRADPGSEGHEAAAAARLTDPADEAGGPDRTATAGHAEAGASSGDTACVADARPERRRGAPPHVDARDDRGRRRRRARHDRLSMIGRDAAEPTQPIRPPAEAVPSSAEPRNLLTSPPVNPAPAAKPAPIVTPLPPPVAPPKAAAAKPAEPPPPAKPVAKPVPPKPPAPAPQAPSEAPPVQAPPHEAPPAEPPAAPSDEPSGNPPP